jgi:hypothetical protein
VGKDLVQATYMIFDSQGPSFARTMSSRGTRQDPTPQTCPTQESHSPSKMVDRILDGVFSTICIPSSEDSKDLADVDSETNT